MLQLNITVQKRNGNIVPYEFDRIQTAIMKALISTEIRAFFKNVF